jgi:4-amino-4-deoxy-L-arabinose transferase-like glycosyltransferase
MLACVGGAFWAQRSLDLRHDPEWQFVTYLGVAFVVWAVAVYLGATLVFAWLVRTVPMGHAPPAPRTSGRLQHPGMFGVGLALAYASFVLFDDNRFTVWNLGAWLIGLVLCFLAFRPPADERPERAGGLWRLAESDTVAIRWEWLALAAIVLLGTVLRLYRLDAIPAEKWGDLGFHYGDVRSIWQGDYQIYFPLWGGGREPIYFYLLAILTYFFGFSSLATKFLSAMIGVGTLVAVFLWGREMYGRQVALFAALLLAISKWHIILSRSSFRASLLPLATCLVGYLLVRALRTRRTLDWAWTGLFLGLAFYTYPTTLGLPVAVALSLGGAALAGGFRPNRQRILNVMVMLLLAAAVLVPLARTVYENPHWYWNRGSVDDPGGLLGAPVEGRTVVAALTTYADRVRRSFAQYHFEGNTYGYYMIPWERHMGFVDAVLLAFGFVYCVVFWRRGHNLILPLFVVGMLLPVILVALPEASWATNAVRSSATLGPVCIMAALALALLARWCSTQLAAGWSISLGVGAADAGAERRLSFGLRGRWIAAIVVATLLVLQFHDSTDAYFRRYAQGIEWANYPLNLEMARLVQEFEQNANGQAFIKQWPSWYDIYTVRAAMLDWDWKRDVIDLEAVRQAPGNVLVLVHPDDKDTLSALTGMFAKHASVTHLDGRGKPVIIAFYGMRTR